MRLKLYSSQRSQFPRNVDKSWGTHTSENPKQCVTGLVPRVLYHFWRLGGSLRMRLVGGWGPLNEVTLCSIFYHSYHPYLYWRGWQLQLRTGKERGCYGTNISHPHLDSRCGGKEAGKTSCKLLIPHGLLWGRAANLGGKRGEEEGWWHSTQCQPKTLARWTSSLIQLPIEEQLLRPSGAKSQ